MIDYLVGLPLGVLPEDATVAPPDPGPYALLKDTGRYVLLADPGRYALIPDPGRYALLEDD